MKIRIFFALVAFVTGIGLVIFNALHGNWISSISFLLVGGLVAFCCLLGFLQSFEILEWNLVALLAGILGICAVLFENPSFDAKRVKAHAEALDAFMRIGSNCQDSSKELEALKEEGIKACVFQDYSEMIRAIGELQKANTLGPTLSLIDGVRSAAKKPDSDWCAEAYLATKSLCPLAFYALSEESVFSLEIKK